MIGVLNTSENSPVCKWRLPSVLLLPVLLPFLFSFEDLKKQSTQGYPYYSSVSFKIGDNKTTENKIL